MGDGTPPLPTYVRELWPEVVPRAVTNGFAALTSTATVAYARAAFDNEVETMAGTLPGGRNDQLNTSAFNLGQLVGGGVLDRYEVEDALRLAALSTGLPASEVDATLASGMRAGEEHARGVPDSGQADSPVTVLEDAPAVADPEPVAPADALTFVDWHDAFANEQVEEWVVEPLIPARRLVALFSPAKVGKSLLMLELAAAISLGNPVMGATAQRARRVLYVDFENDVSGDVVPRLRAMGYGPDDLAELRYLSFPSLPFLDNPMGGLVLTDVCDRHQVEVVVIDTISRAVGGEENDNDTWLGFYRHTGLALKKRGVTTVRLDHTGKDITKGMRGGSAKYSDVDVAWQMTPLEDEVFRVECVANRLPITEKLLTLERVTDPLRHQLSLKRPVDVEAELELELVATLDRLGVPRGDGRVMCEHALREAHQPWKGKHLAAAVAWRKRHPEEPVPGVTELTPLYPALGTGLEP